MQIVFIPATGFVNRKLRQARNFYLLISSDYPTLMFIANRRIKQCKYHKLIRLTHLTQINTLVNLGITSDVES